jgi:hypothetical protein
MTLDPFSGVPQNVEIFDGFDDSSLSRLMWAPLDNCEQGGTKITETAGKLNIKNDGTEIAGISYLSTLHPYPRHIRISVDMEMLVSTGEHAEASLVLWKDTNNWMRFGMYRDTSEGINDMCYLRINFNGDLHDYRLAPSEVELNNNLTYTVALTEHSIILFYDDVFVTSFEWPELVNYYVWLEAGTQYGADTLHVAFNDFDVNNHFDYSMMRIGLVCGTIKQKWDGLEEDADDIIANTQQLLEDTSSLISLAPVPVVFNSSIVLTDTSQLGVEFRTATYGVAFRLSMAFNITGAHIDFCRLFDASVSTFYNEDSVAQDIAEGDIYLAPMAGPGINDYIAFGTLHPSRRMDIVIGAGGKVNVGNTFAWYKMDGAGSQVSLSVTDGTTGLKKDGSVTWTGDLVLDTINGIQAYWVIAKITTAGGATDIPKGSRVVFCPTSFTDFNSRASFGSFLIAELYRKIDGVYRQAPSDIMYFQQSNVNKDISLDLIAYSDTKVMFRLGKVPISDVTIPYTGAVIRI